jgi:hypothetical protein
MVSIEPAGPAKDELWANDLDPKQVVDRLRSGLAQYLRSEESRERVVNRSRQS